MIKRFSYMIALAFLFQMNWAVASAFCMHESGKASQHFGHHAHQHEGESTATDEEQPVPAKKASYHPDCASCAHGTMLVFNWSGEFVHKLLTDHLLRTPLPTQPAPYLGLPERPNWMSAA